MLEGLRLVTEVALASPWLLMVIVALAVVDALLPVVPSEALVIGAGVASAAGEQNLLAVIAAAGIGAFVGEVAGYLIGRGLGPAVRTRLPRGSAKEVAFSRIERLLTDRGGTMLLMARFIPAGRTVATLAAGATAYPAPRFLAFTALGAPLSAAYVALLGYLGGTAFANDTIAALLFSLGIATSVTLVVESVRRVTQRRRAAARDQRVQMKLEALSGSPA
jgi:membrane-associated protein